MQWLLRSVFSGPLKRLVGAAAIVAAGRGKARVDDSSRLSDAEKDFAKDVIDQTVNDLLNEFGEEQ